MLSNVSPELSRMLLCCAVFARGVKIHVPICFVSGHGGLLIRWTHPDSSKACAEIGLPSLSEPQRWDGCGRKEIRALNDSPLAVMKLLEHSSCLFFICVCHLHQFCCLKLAIIWLFVLGFFWLSFFSFSFCPWTVLAIVLFGFVFLAAVEIRLGFRALLVNGNIFVHAGLWPIVEIFYRCRQIFILSQLLLKCRLGFGVCQSTSHCSDIALNSPYGMLRKFWYIFVHCRFVQCCIEKI